MTLIDLHDPLVSATGRLLTEKGLLSEAGKTSPPGRHEGKYTGPLILWFRASDYEGPHMSSHSSTENALLGKTGADRAFFLLRTVFVVAPIAFGLDKFVEILTDWDKYLAPWINDIVPGNAHQAMLIVGVIEILAGLLVAIAPRCGSLLVAAWLTGIIINLVTLGDFYDVALRDFGLLVGALALAALAFDRDRHTA